MIITKIAPAGMAPGSDPFQWRKAIHARIKRHLDEAHRLIDALDAMDIDADLEDSADDEYSLGWTERGPQAGENYSDLEEVGEDEGAQCDDEGVVDWEDAELVTWGGSEEVPSTYQ